MNQTKNLLNSDISINRWSFLAKLFYVHVFAFLIRTKRILAKENTSISIFNLPKLEKS